MALRIVSALFAFLLGLLAFGVLGAAGYAARELPEVSWLEAAGAEPVSGMMAFFALVLATRARALHQRTLGRSGEKDLARTARAIGLLALLIVLTAALALGVFGVLVATAWLTRAPW